MKVIRKPITVSEEFIQKRKLKSLAENTALIELKLVETGHLAVAEIVDDTDFMAVLKVFIMQPKDPPDQIASQIMVYDKDQKRFL